MGKERLRDNDHGEKFSQKVRDEVYARQGGISVITDRPISQYHHITGRMGKRTDTSAKNCLGVDIVAHALIHMWQWSVAGDEGEWDACQGQVSNMTEEERKLFYQLKDRQDLSEPYIKAFEEMVAQEEQWFSTRSRQLHYVC